MSVRTKFTTQSLTPGDRRPYTVLVKNRSPGGTLSATKPKLSLPGKPSYIDCRFETDMKVLLGKMDRMEALMEKLIEVVYYQQEAQPPAPSKRGGSRIAKQDDGYRFFEEEEQEEEEHLTDVDELTMMNDASQGGIEALDEEEPMEEYVIEELEAEPGQPRKKFKSDHELPKEINVNEFVLPLSTVGDLETFDDLVSNDKDVRDRVTAIIDDILTEDRTFRDIFRHIITDDVLEGYIENRNELKNLYLIKVVLRECYGRKREIKQFWRRFDSLFGHSSMTKRNCTDSYYEAEEFRLPIKSIMELEELDRKVRAYPQVKNELFDAMKDLYMMADRNNANFLAKFIGKDCLDECSWSSKSKKKNRLMDFKIFNDLYPRTLGLAPNTKQVEDLLRTALNQLRHRYYSRKHREMMKQSLTVSHKVKAELGTE